MKTDEARQIVALAARATLEQGGVIAFATESSYGLGVDPRNRTGVETIYRLKGRERGKPLPVVAASLEQLCDLPIDPLSPELAWGAQRWPAALSVLLPLIAPLAASDGGDCVAARVPDRPSLCEFLAAIGTPLTATSANAAGAPPLLDPRQVASWLEASGELYCLVDEGPAPGGAPSTLVELRDGELRILRAGRVHVG